MDYSQQKHCALVFLWQITELLSKLRRYLFNQRQMTFINLFYLYDNHLLFL